MTDKQDYLAELLAHMGLKAEVRRDESNAPVIIIETKLYHEKRRLIDSWFKLEEERGDFCSFRERLRGTGDTQ